MHGWMDTWIHTCMDGWSGDERERPRHQQASQSAKRWNILDWNLLDRALTIIYNIQHAASSRGINKWIARAIDD